MRYCSNCGSLNDTDANFCSNCGTPLKSNLENPNNNPDKMNQPVYEYTQTPQAVPAQPLYAAPEQAPVKGKVFGILSFVFGIASTVLAFLSIIPFIGQIVGFLHLAMAIVGLIFSGKSDFRLAKPGKILCIVGIALSAIFLIIGFIMLAEGLYSILDSIYYYRYF